MAAWRLARRPPPQRVHFKPKEAKHNPNAASTHESTIVVRAVCKYAGSANTEYFSVQLNMPVLYQVQSIHRPCICEMAVMMFEPTSALTFQLGNNVATVAPKMPSNESTKAKICVPVDAILPRSLTRPTFTQPYLVPSPSAATVTAEIVQHQSLLEESERELTECSPPPAH